jgi:adhesin transport system membrane fusion protein
MHGTHLEDLTTRIKPRTASNLLLWFVVAFIVAFFLWAGFTKLDRTVRGQGQVIPSARLQIVSNLEGGVVQAILVHSGQLVRAGDVLLRLDPSSSVSELGSGLSEVSSLQL